MKNKFCGNIKIPVILMIFNIVLFFGCKNIESLTIQELYKVKRQKVGIKQC